MRCNSAKNTMRSAAFAALLITVSVSAVAQTADYTTISAQEKAKTAQKQVEWADDMDQKLDTTMKVLDVIRGELEEYKREEKAAAKRFEAQANKGVTPEDAEAEWITNLRLTLERIRRVMAKMKKAVPQEDAATPTPAQEQTKKDTLKDLQKGLTQAMEAMSVVRDEIEKMETDDAGSSR